MWRRKIWNDEQRMVLSLETENLFIVDAQLMLSKLHLSFVFNLKLLCLKYHLRSSQDVSNFVTQFLIQIWLPLAGVLPEALRTRCDSCTKVQKSKALNVITRLYYQHPSIYNYLAERYDPTGEYTRNFENWFDEQNAVKPRPPIPQEVIERDEGK